MVIAEAMKKITTNWVDTSNYDIQSAERMHQAGRYIYVIFFCHLAVEKLVKAVVAEQQDSLPPRIHNLITLAKLGNVEPPLEFKLFLSKLNNASVVTRYPEDLNKLKSVYTKAVSAKYLSETKGFLKWLKTNERLRK